MADVKVALRELKEESDSGPLPVKTAAVPRPWRAWAAAAALALVVAAGAIGVVVWRDRTQGPTARQFRSLPFP